MIEIIPAIDLIDRKCVRLSQGDFSSSKIYDEDPVAVASRFEDAGFKRVHIVDLDGARTGRIRNLRVLENIARCTSLTVDFGGGIKSIEHLQQVFDVGAEIVTLGSIAITNPDMFRRILEKYSGGKILLGADVRSHRVFINGWQTPTNQFVVPFIRKALQKGLQQVFVTDILLDGCLNGPSVGLYSHIRKSIPEIDLIASGGVSKIEDIDAVEQAGCSGVIVGKAIYEGRIDLKILARRGTATSAIY